MCVRLSARKSIFAKSSAIGHDDYCNGVISTFDFRFSENIIENLKKPLKGMIEISLFLDTFWRTFLDFSFAETGYRGRMTIEIRAFIRKPNRNKISGHVFEFHTLS